MKTQRPDSNEPRQDDPGFRRRHARNRGHADRKQRVLHTRISEQLAEDIRHFAEDLRVPASNLVRNVLEEVFSVVDRVSGDLGELMDDLIDEAEGVRDRVRRQANPASGSGSERSRRRFSRRRRANPPDVEEELRQDEAAEAASSEESPRPATAAGPASSVNGEPSEPQSSRANPTQPRAAELFPDILGWQPLVLNRDFNCGRCERPLPAGESAFLGIGTAGVTGTALCGRCAAVGRR